MLPVFRRVNYRIEKTVHGYFSLQSDWLVAFFLQWSYWGLLCLFCIDRYLVNLELIISAYTLHIQNGINGSCFIGDNFDLLFPYLRWGSITGRIIRSADFLSSCLSIILKYLTFRFHWKLLYTMEKTLLIFKELIYAYIICGFCKN